MSELGIPAARRLAQFVFAKHFPTSPPTPVVLQATGEVLVAQIGRMPPLVRLALQIVIALRLYRGAFVRKLPVLGELSGLAERLTVFIILCDGNVKLT